jgi:hypothetical protein
MAKITMTRNAAKKMIGMLEHSVENGLIEWDDDLDRIMAVCFEVLDQ